MHYLIHVSQALGEIQTLITPSLHIRWWCLEANRGRVMPVYALPHLSLHYFASVDELQNIKHTFFLTCNSTSRTLPVEIQRKVYQDSHLMGRGDGDNPRSPLAARSVKNLPAMRETWVRSLGWKDPLEKEMATHSSILAWKISWTEESGGLQSMGSQRVRHD